jgi:hypothetical protein
MKIYVVGGTTGELRSIIMDANPVKDRSDER